MGCFWEMGRIQRMRKQMVQIQEEYVRLHANSSISLVSLQLHLFIYLFFIFLFIYLCIKQIVNAENIEKTRFSRVLTIFRNQKRQCLWQMVMSTFTPISHTIETTCLMLCRFSLCLYNSSEPSRYGLHKIFQQDASSRSLKSCKL